MSVDAIRLDAADEVATALRLLSAGSEITVSGPDGTTRLRVVEDIPAFHKVALDALPAGTRVKKYGAVIGALATPVAAGGLVHVHNLKSLRARGAGAAT